MKNMTTREFCKKFGACQKGAKFALKYDNMRECYNALLKGEAGNDSADWAIWVASQRGVFPESALQKLAINVARKVTAWQTPENTGKINAYELYANGKISAEKLEAVGLFNKPVAERVWDWLNCYCWDCGTKAACAQEIANPKDKGLTVDAMWSGYRAGKEECIKLLAELGNPFQEAC